MNARLSALLVLAALAAGCGSDDDATATSADAVTTSAAPLAGTYERSLTRADIERTDRL